MSDELLQMLKTCEALPEQKMTMKTNTRARVAVASREGVLVNQHLGEAKHLLIYGQKNGEVSLLEVRRTPEAGGGMQRWNKLADTISDCSLLLVGGIGANPRHVLTDKGIEILEIEGLIDEAVRTALEGGSLRHLIKRKAAACGAMCSGTGAGCG